jgi:hypothetical protein
MTIQIIDGEKITTFNSFAKLVAALSPADLKELVAAIEEGLGKKIEVGIDIENIKVPASHVSYQNYTLSQIAASKSYYRDMLIQHLINYSSNEFKETSMEFWVRLTMDQLMLNSDLKVFFEDIQKKALAAKVEEARKKAEKAANKKKSDIEKAKKLLAEEGILRNDNS